MTDWIDSVTALSQGSLEGTGLKIAIVVSRFSGEPCQRLLDGALERLMELGTSQQDIDVTSVPGAFEIPIVATELSRGRPRKYDAIITLGVLLRGETPHFDLIAAEVTRALSETARTTGVPVSFGVLTAETSEQASDRAGGKMGNRGWDAAQAAIEMACLGRELG